MQSSGLQRATYIAKSETGIRRLVEAGVAQRVVNILDASDNQKCQEAALEALQEMSRDYDAREAFVLAGSDPLKILLPHFFAGFRGPVRRRDYSIHTEWIGTTSQYSFLFKLSCFGSSRPHFKFILELLKIRVCSLLPIKIHSLLQKA